MTDWFISLSIFQHSSYLVDIETDSRESHGKENHEKESHKFNVSHILCGLIIEIYVLLTLFSIVNGLISENSSYSDACDPLLQHMNKSW